MPSLTTLTTKALHLEALLNVRRYVWFLTKQEIQMTPLLCWINTTQYRGLALQPGVDSPSTDTTQSGLHLYQQGLSLVENILASYKYNAGGNESYSKNVKIASKNHLITCQSHPYDSSKDFLSRFLLEFRGYYYRSSISHFNIREYNKVRRRTLIRESILRSCGFISLSQNVRIIRVLGMVIRRMGGYEWHSPTFYTFLRF